MKASVILCTYNRCESLAKALESVAVSQVHPSIAWEVLVVDNNSRDRTREVVEEFSGRYPGRVRYMFEGQPGKSYALNAGIREAHGDVLAFMDDDVTVEQSWLQNLTSPLRDGKWVGSGGRVFPDRTVAFPNWISLEDRCTAGPLVMFDLGPTPGTLKEPPFGTNMAFDRRVFERHGGFRTDLGPQPGSEIRGEDSEFVLRLLAAGEPLCYAPSAVVYHAVPEGRLTKEYFLAWWFDKGRSETRTRGSASNTQWSVAGIPLVLFRRLAVWSLRWLFGATPSQRFIPKVRVWYLAGEITESFRSRGRPDARKHIGDDCHSLTASNVGWAANPIETRSRER